MTQLISALTGALATPYTLVITDMQPGFQASLDARTIAGCQREIAAARQAQMPIVFVESDPDAYGDVDPSLTGLVVDYNPDLWTVERKFYRWQEENSAHSGAKQVSEVCEVFGFPQERFRHCGVNTDICVFFTAWELALRHPQSLQQIVLSACNRQTGGSFSLDQGKAFAFYAERYDFVNYEVVA